MDALNQAVAKFPTNPTVFIRRAEFFMKDELVMAQLNTDTCRQEVVVPADLDLPETLYRDAWVMRSYYCGKHFVHFPLWGSQTTYIITFNPYRTEEARDRDRPPQPRTP